LALAVRIDPGGDLAILYGQIASAADGARSFFGGESGGRFDETVHTAIPLLCGHGQKAQVFRLAMSEGERSFDGGAERVFIDTIGGGAGGAAIGNRTDGDGQAMLGDVLVNGVVGETGQGVGNFVDVNFGLFRSGGFG